RPRAARAAPRGGRVIPATFQLCRNAQHEGAVRRVVDGCAGFLADRLPGKLVGLVLTGSFSRGEGTVLAVNGHLRVLGDIEFLVVVPRMTDYRALRRRANDWGREASARLGAPSVSVDIEFGPVEVGYLRHRARPSIFVYDLATHGKVVWGPPDLLRAIPAFGPERIPREDALDRHAVAFPTPAGVGEARPASEPRAPARESAPRARAGPALDAARAALRRRRSRLRRPGARRQPRAHGREAAAAARRPGRPAYAGRRPRRRDGVLALVRSQQLRETWTRRFPFTCSWTRSAGRSSATARSSTTCCPTA